MNTNHVWLKARSFAPLWEFAWSCALCLWGIYQPCHNVL